MFLIERLIVSRPEKHIDWDKVDRLLIAGCLGTEIAPHFDLHPNTFYDRVLAEKGIGFTEYSTQKKSQGDACLREVQYEKALTGDNTMLVWLGKQRLNQRDHKDETSQHQKIVVELNYSNDHENPVKILPENISITDSESVK